MSDKERLQLEQECLFKHSKEQVINLYLDELDKNNQLKEKIDKAIEYIKELQNSCLVFSNIAYKELLEILGDKENE